MFRDTVGEEFSRAEFRRMFRSRVKKCRFFSGREGF
jgi:hypothetical protein